MAEATAEARWSTSNSGAEAFGAFPRTSGDFRAEVFRRVFRSLLTAACGSRSDPLAARSAASLPSLTSCRTRRSLIPRICAACATV
jgi:hypothetical protein